MSSEADTIVLRGLRDCFTMAMLGRQFPDDQAYWDGNWIVTPFRANRSWFEVDFTRTLHLSDLRRLRNELVKMLFAYDGPIEWEPLDGFLKLVSAIDESGRIRWVIEMVYDDLEGATLSIEINNDSTSLPEILSQIDSVLEAFPPRGRHS